MSAKGKGCAFVPCDQAAVCGLSGGCVRERFTAPGIHGAELEAQTRANGARQRRPRPRPRAGRRPARPTKEQIAAVRGGLAVMFGKGKP